MPPTFEEALETILQERKDKTMNEQGCTLEDIRFWFDTAVTCPVNEDGKPNESTYEVEDDWEPFMTPYHCYCGEEFDEWKDVKAHLEK